MVLQSEAKRIRSDLQSKSRIRAKRGCAEGRTGRAEGLAVVSYACDPE